MPALALNRIIKNMSGHNVFVGYHLRLVGLFYNAIVDLSNNSLDLFQKTTLTEQE